MWVFKFMLCSWLIFRPSFTQPVMDAHRNLGSLGLFCEKWGLRWGHGYIDRFLGERVAPKKKSPDFRSPEIGISASHPRIADIYVTK